MLNFLKPFDTYTIRARIIPALLAGLPTLALPFVLVPWDKLGLSNAIVSVMTFVLLYAFADLARRCGYRVEAKLGTRSTPELWFRSNREISNAIKDIYRSFIAGRLNINEPSAEDEEARNDHALDFYQGASEWLRDQTRDTKKFPLLFNELLTYGYRRNMLGLKPLAILSNIIIAAVCASILHIRPYIASNINNFDEKMIALVFVVVLHTAYLIVGVDRAGVYQASQNYGKRLILSCGNLMPAKTTRSSRKSKG